MGCTRAALVRRPADCGLRAGGLSGPRRDRAGGFGSTPFPSHTLPSTLT